MLLCFFLGVGILAPSDKTVKITANITGLQPYTQYKFRAIAVNDIGEGTPSQPSGESVVA